MAALGVDADHAHLHLVAYLHDVFNALDPVAWHQLRDVDQAAESEEVDECAVGHRPVDPA
jgi:hypothetical protein